MNDSDLISYSEVLFLSIKASTVVFNNFTFLSLVDFFPILPSFRYTYSIAFTVDGFKFVSSDTSFKVFPFFVNSVIIISLISWLIFLYLIRCYSLKYFIFLVPFLILLDCIILSNINLIIS